MGKWKYHEQFNEILSFQLEYYRNSPANTSIRRRKDIQEQDNSQCSHVVVVADEGHGPVAVDAAPEVLLHVG